MNDHETREINIIYLFLEDDFYRWPVDSQLEALINLNKGIRIIGINYPVSLLTLFFNPMRFIKKGFKNKCKIRENLYSFAPFSFLPVSIINRHPILITLHRFLFKLQINKYLKQIHAMENRVTLLYKLEAFPAFHETVNNNKLLVYDCQDEHTLKEDKFIKTAQEIENIFLKKADIVFTIAEYPYKSRLLKNKNTFLVPNGVDFDLFNQADSPHTKIHPELINIPKPIIGYVGHTRSWLDFELLEFLASCEPQISFVFVGTIEKDIMPEVNSLKKHGNVYFLPWKERKYLPFVIKAFDVCMIPFKYNRFNLSTNPLKYWEYLATGKPILSLKIPDLIAYEDRLALYVTKEEALAKLRLLLQEKDPTLKAKRIDLARNSDVSLRANARYEILKKFLNAKSKPSA